MLYEIIIFIGSFIARIIALFDKKMAKFFLLRKGEINRVAGYFCNYKNKKSKVIWFHASSAGELEQAKPLIEHFKRGKKNAKGTLIIASFFSPSGYEAGLKYKNLDFCFNLPLDYRKNAKRLLDCINPKIIIYSKYDVWTNLTVEARKRNIKLALISATLPEKSLRHRLPYSIFFSKAYSALDRIYAISKADAERLGKISNNKNSIIVSGDTRFDRVKTVIENTKLKSKSIIKKQKDFIYIVAGSTYKICEQNLLSAIKQLNDKDKRIKLVLVPHEIDHNNIRRLNKLVSSTGYNPVNYSKVVQPVLLKDNEVLIVDAFGVLAYLYNEADIVFIGGSYKGSVHSVLEPAIFGKAILTGPYIQNSYEAIKLKEIGGLKVCANKDELYKEILKLSMDVSYRTGISQISKKFFKDNMGASSYILKDIEKIL
jgi:3-deoxy-D-manno-octulosonic-acid transferase